MALREAGGSAPLRLLIKHTGLYGSKSRTVQNTTRREQVTGRHHDELHAPGQRRHTFKTHIMAPRHTARRCAARWV